MENIYHEHSYCPTLLNINRQNIIVHFVDQVKTFSENITTDINAIMQRFVPFISLGDTFIFVEQQRRTNAFIACCHVHGKLNETLLRKYVDAYGSSLEQDNIINNCSKTLHSSLDRNCRAGLNEISEARNITKE